MGAGGQVWLARLPGLLADLAAEWSITVGTRLDGGRASYVAETTTHDGTPAVADKVAAATAEAKPDQTRLGEPLTPLRVTGERWPTRQHHRPSPELDDVRPEPVKLLLMVGLPGAGKTTRAQELAAAHRALRLTPDEWMISLFDGSQPDGKRDLLEGRLIALALQALQLGTNVVLDFGLWSRDERSALRWLGTSAGASCQVIYLPVDTDVQRARIAHRQATAPHTTFPMTDADIDKWRRQFQAPDAAELRDGRTIPDPPPGWPGWPEWAVDRWPSFDPSQPSASTPTPHSVGSPTSIETGPTTSPSEPPSIRRAPKKKGNSARTK